MRLSASQIEKFRSCPRSWGFEYIDGLPRPSTLAADFGREGHKAIETWLTTGTFPGSVASDIKTLVSKAIKPGLLPTPDRRLLVEREFHFSLGYEITVKGFIDCVVPAELNDGVAIVIDHKFRSGSRWAMSEDSLRTDTQAIIYSFAALLLTKTPAVLNRWLYYYSTGSAKSRPKKPDGVDKIEILRTPDEVDDLMKPIVRTALEMQSAKQNGRSFDLLPCFDFCEAFGGCPYVEKCRSDSSPKSRAVASFRQMSGLDGFKKQDTSDLVAKNKEDLKMALIDDLRAKREAAKRAGTTKPPEVSETPDPELVSEASAETGSKVSKLKKPGPGRLPKQAEPPEQTEPSEFPVSKPGRFRLLVNCFAYKAGNMNDVVRLEDIVETAMKKIERDFGVAHWKLIEYGRDKPTLELAFDEWLDSADLSGDIYLDTKTASGQALLELLTRKATEVIRGYF